jgi:hypothetical protein
VLRFPPLRQAAKRCASFGGQFADKGRKKASDFFHLLLAGEKKQLFFSPAGLLSAVSS